MRVLKWLGIAVAAFVLGAVAWLAIAPPDLIRVATNYSAKIVCSNVFLANRPADMVLADDVQAPGHPVLRFVSVDVDEARRRVEASVLGLFATATSVARSGYGCTNLHHSDGATVANMPDPNEGDTSAKPLDVAIDPAIQTVIENETLAGPAVRAIVVLRDGVVVAERYAEGFDAKTPLLGWSMSKTVTAALIGRMEMEGLLSRDDDGLFDAWATDARAQVTVADLLAMSSDLTWNESYGAVSDVTRMLFLEGDMTNFVAQAELGTEDGSQIGQVFNYSSGTTVALAAYWQNVLGAEAETFPDDMLFDPLGMDAATMETDETGTFVGGSYMYAPAREWARFGQFLLQDGVWDGERLLPEDYVDWMVTPHPASNGLYANGHIWRVPSNARDEAIPASLADTAWLGGHDGQSVAVMRDASLVVVRMGLTPKKLDYSPKQLAIAVREAAGR